jgi:hypothetical protein
MAYTTAACWRPVGGIGPRRASKPGTACSRSTVTGITGRSVNHLRNRRQGTALARGPRACGRRLTDPAAARCAPVAGTGSAPPAAAPFCGGQQQVQDGLAGHGVPDQGEAVPAQLVDGGFRHGEVTGHVPGTGSEPTFQTSGRPGKTRTMSRQVPKVFPSSSGAADRSGPRPASEPGAKARARQAAKPTVWG